MKAKNDLVNILILSVLKLTNFISNKRFSTKYEF